MDESAQAAVTRVELDPRGLRLGPRVVPLLSGSIHYFRLDPRDFRAVLSAQRELGLRMVDVYVPWGIHEARDGVIDFGQRDPRLDVVRFLELAASLEMLAIVRPGPHINAELTYFGIPERIIRDRECQARSPRGMPVLLPVPPLAFPVPSYASERFLEQACAWLEAVAERLAPLVWPRGPIVLAQVDNEGSFYFRDGVYDQDYHPDAVAHYRRFVLDKYRDAAGVRVAYGDASLDPSTLAPPTRASAESPEVLARHLDWAEAQEAVLERALRRMRGALERGGFGSIPFCHNLPMGEGTTALDPARLERAVDVISLDYYHGASELSRAEVARRSGALAARAAARGYAAFASELGAGFPPFFPPLCEADSEFTTLTALAYGLRGFNVYMAVERERWVGAPIDRHGRLRPFAEFWRRLVRAFERNDFAGLTRAVAVRVLVPRSYFRLARTLHAFGPVSLAVFAIGGGGVQAACLEAELGGHPAPLSTTERFLRDLEQALELERVPYAMFDGDLVEQALQAPGWVVVACCGALEADLAHALGRARSRGAAVSFGPFAPEFDPAFRRRAEPVTLTDDGRVPARLGGGPDALRAAVRAARRELELPVLELGPEAVFGTLHHDVAGVPRVAFVLNSSDREVTAELGLTGLVEARDALDGDEFHATFARLELPMRPRSARMLELRF